MITETCLKRRESELYKDLTQLSRAERRVLNQPLQDSNKDAVVLYHEENSIIGTSLEKGSCLGIVTLLAW